MTLTFRVTVGTRLESGDGETASLLEAQILEKLEDAGPLKVTVLADDGGEEVYEVTNWTAEPLYEEI